MLFRLAIKNITSRKSSLVIVLFISFAVMLMCIINSIFDSTENGIEKVFSRSFTGDFVIRADTDKPISLFGDETPVTGELTTVDNVVPYGDIIDYLRSRDCVVQEVSQVSGRAMMEFGSYREPAFLFGIQGEDYVKAMSSIDIIEGVPFASEERGVMLPVKTAEKMKVHVGDTVQFTVVDGPIFRIRAAKLTAIYNYPVENITLDRIVLVDAVTVRALMNMSEASADPVDIDANYIDMFTDENLDLEMFDDAEDFTAVYEDFSDEEVLRSTPEAKADDGFESTSWNFVVGCFGEGSKLKKEIHRMNRDFRKKAWPVKAVGWRDSAGGVSMYLYLIRLIFNAGVLVILAAGFIIINNTLVVNVLSRTQEIGTLRAQGASRAYVSLQCMIETFALTITAGIIGCILGTIGANLLTGANIEFNNSFLVQLFGEEVLIVHTSAMRIFKSMVFAMFLGLLGWVYPVKTALSVNPVQAMQGAV